MVLDALHEPDQQRQSHGVVGIAVPEILHLIRIVFEVVQLAPLATLPDTQPPATVDISMNGDDAVEAQVGILCRLFDQCVVACSAVITSEQVASPGLR